jgi:hypothetical protein
VIFNNRQNAGEADRWRSIILLCTVAFGIASLLILRAVAIHFPRRFRCGECSYIWLPD